VLQETVAGLPVRCLASQWLYQARCGNHSCVQAAAAARVAGGRDILKSAGNGDGASVLCHLIADAEGVSEQDGFCQTPLHLSASEGHLEVCRLLLRCNADVESENLEYCRRAYYFHYYCFYEAKLSLRMLILLLFFQAQHSTASGCFRRPP
jgi:hypothetical protein